eukprot:10669542-Ditylum_brightwellii.AAC.1
MERLVQEMTCVIMTGFAAYLPIIGLLVLRLPIYLGFTHYTPIAGPLVLPKLAHQETQWGLSTAGSHHVTMIA